MIFKLLNSDSPFPLAGTGEVFLRIDHWNDYSFVTMFRVFLFDDEGEMHEIGQVKIGFTGQTEKELTHATLDREFEELPGNYFSLGTGVEYYDSLGKIPDKISDQYLSAMRDVVWDDNNIKQASGQEVYRVSLLRSVSMSVIEGQFRRVLNGGVPLTDFEFSYSRPSSDEVGGLVLEFKVGATSKPRTNIHAVIGRNGVGKTTLLNGMIDSITEPAQSSGSFLVSSLFGDLTKIGPKYFSQLVSVSFSAFDPFVPPPNQTDPELGTCYCYIGLKKNSHGEESSTKESELKELDDLHGEFIAAIKECVSDIGKRSRWSDAISTLESDENFAELDLKSLLAYRGDELSNMASKLVKEMSAGHSIVLLTITKLVATVEEKTLVVLDEPESHLHPPLLSAFTRALSELLSNRNGVAIVATHSPVVLQEIPRTCVWKLTRSGMAVSNSRPRTETFGENVGVLTREVFGLEVVKSGFHTLLAEAVADGLSYEEALSSFDQQLGFEAKSILRSMVFERDKGSEF